jgi:hypothetical protein
MPAPPAPAPTRQNLCAEDLARISHMPSGHCPSCRKRMPDQKVSSSSGRASSRVEKQTVETGALATCRSTDCHSSPFRPETPEIRRACEKCRLERFRLIPTYGPPRLQEVCSIWLRSLRQRIRSQGCIPGQDGDPRGPILISLTASSAIGISRVSERRSTVRPSLAHHSQTLWASPLV